MTHSKAGDPRPAGPVGSDAPATVYCKLFSDRVSEHLCLLRKKELNLKGGFSCKGCSMDAIISKRLKQVTDILGTAREPEK